MRRRVLSLVVLLVACSGEKKQSGLDPAAGHALLAEFVEAFQQLARSGTVEGLDSLLAAQAAKGDELKAAGKVPAAFAERHRRLIEVTRAIIAPGGREAAAQKVREFLDAVEGKKERALAGGLAEIGPALLEEVLRLHMLLDGTTDREKTRDKYLADLPR